MDFRRSLKFGGERIFNSPPKGVARWSPGAAAAIATITHAYWDVARKNVAA